MWPVVTACSPAKMNKKKKKLAHFEQRFALSPLLIDHYRILQQSQLGLRGEAT